MRKSYGMNRKELGDQGELEAVKFLENLGYIILERNWRWKQAEIDIVCKIDSIIVFVEVKTKSYTYFGDPESGLSTEQEERIMDASSAYMRQCEYEGEIRFDIVSVLWQEGRFLLEHFEDAFWSEW